jgi:hypothetical protein
MRSMFFAVAILSWFAVGNAKNIEQKSDAQTLAGNSSSEPRPWWWDKCYGLDAADMGWCIHLQMLKQRRYSGLSPQEVNELRARLHLAYKRLDPSEDGNSQRSGIRTIFSELNRVYPQDLQTAELAGGPGAK